MCACMNDFPCRLRNATPLDVLHQVADYYEHNKLIKAIVGSMVRA